MRAVGTPETLDAEEERFSRPYGTDHRVVIQPGVETQAYYQASLAGRALCIPSPRYEME